MNDKRALSCGRPVVNPCRGLFVGSSMQVTAPEVLAGVVPLDLHGWVDDESLMTWIQEETDRVVSQSASLFGFPRRNCAGEMRQLCAVLALAYASRIFESEEIVDSCASNPAFVSLSAGRRWSAQELSTFRRQHRPLLEAILAAVFLRALRRRFALPETFEAGELEGSLRERAVARLNIARHMDRSDF